MDSSDHQQPGTDHSPPKVKERGKPSVGLERGGLRLFGEKDTWGEGMEEGSARPPSLLRRECLEVIGWSGWEGPA